MSRYTIRTRLIIILLILFSLVLVPSFIYIYGTLQGISQQHAEENARQTLNTVEWALTKAPAFDGPRDLDTWLAKYQSASGVRISYIVDGKVLADSALDYDVVQTLPTHAQREEVAAAQSGVSKLIDRVSSTTQQEYLYMAKKTSLVKGLPAGILRVAIPVAPNTAYGWNLTKTLLAAFILSLLACSIVSFIVTKPLLRVIRELSSLASRIGQGEYSLRMPDAGGQELQPLVRAINSMAANIEQHTARLEERKNRLEALFNGMQEGVMVFDRNGHITSFNQAAACFFPALLAPAVRTPMEATMSTDLQQAVNLALTIELRKLAAPEAEQIDSVPCFSAEQQKYPTTKPTTLKVTLTGAQGQTLEATLVPFGEGEARRLVAVMVDISEQARLERMRRDFVANVSHELKTPLTNITGYAETLLHIAERKNLDQNPNTQNFLEIIAKNAKHMTHMVEDLLLLAKAEHQSSLTALETVNVGDSLKASISQLEFQLEQSNMRVEMDLGGADLLVKASQEGLFTVFHNILDNAVKYGKQNSAILIKATNSSEGLVLSFYNQGEGIPASERERVFERFYRVQGSRDRTQNGSSGLGLSICRRIINAFQGRIWIDEPEQGQGTIIKIELPYEQQTH